MRAILLHGLLCLLIVLLSGCSREDSVTAPATDTNVQDQLLDLELAASDIVRMTGWPVADGIELPAGGEKNQYSIIDYDREVITGDIVHYTFIVQIGPGEYDRIGVHRVVKERRPYVPQRSRHSIFLLHGDGAPFETAFLMSTLTDAAPVDHNIPVFLAENDIDVWGIDLGWTLVPLDTADLSFMADWGIQRDVDDLRDGLALARTLRLFGGNGWRKMHLLGWSRGVYIGLAYLNEETQLPPGHRQVKGFVPVDGYYKISDDEIRQYECETAAAYEASIADGIYEDATGAFLGSLAVLAQTAPDDPSGFLPGFTNRQAILAIGTSTYQLFGIPWTYHLVAGVFDDNGLPVDLQYTAPDLWVDFGASWAPYQPNRIIAESSWINCDDPAHDLPYDDYLSEITVPILYVGAAGGFGELGHYTLTQLGSTDVSTVDIQLHPDEEIALDFAHVDLFNAFNAMDLVWSPILDWVLEHHSNSGEMPEVEYQLGLR